MSHSFIQEVKPTRTGGLNLYPAQSSRIWISPNDPAYGSRKPKDPQQKSLKRSWYKIGLCVGWHYQQKRSEKIEFILSQKFQIPTLGQNRRHLKLHLEDITQGLNAQDWQPQWNYGAGFQVLYKSNIYTNLRRHKSKDKFEQNLDYWQKEPQYITSGIKGSQGHFFPTDRGRKAIEHAIEIACAHLAISARSIEVCISGPFASFASLTCDHSVQIHDHRLPGRSVWGKVKALKLCLDGQTGKQWGELKLGVSIGDSQNELIKAIRDTSESLKDFYSLDYAEPFYSADRLEGTTSSALTYILKLPSTDYDKWIYPDTLMGRDIIEKVAVKNRAEAQNTYLLQHQYPTHHSIEKTLKKIPTQIHIQLADLKTWKAQIQNYSVDITNSCSAPQQINL